MSIRALADQDHDVIHEILISPAVIVVNGTMVDYGFKRGMYGDAYATARLDRTVPTVETGSADE